jgi:hypothetical protein
MIYIKIYCGNLIFSADDQDLRDLFETATMGDVRDCHVFYDEKTGYSRGFGTARVGKESVAAALALNDTDYRGRRLNVRLWTESARFTQSHWKS